MKKLLFFILGFILLFAWYFNEENPHSFYKYASVINSSGAPPGKTGAPGESNCTMCHSGTLNDGSSSSTISFSGSNNEYVPGSTYDLSLILNNGSALNGFQLVVLDSNSNNNAGTLILSDPVNTQLNSSNNRDYLNHTSNGNSLTSWDFQWTAPSSNVGPIKIYYAYNVAGYPYSSTIGDSIYASFTTLNPANTSSYINSIFLDFDCYIDNEKKLNILSNISSNAESNLEIYNISGNLIYSTTLNLIFNQRSKIDIPYQLSSGIYIVNLSIGDTKKTKKIVL